MPTPADDCVVLFYRGQRYWVGSVGGAGDLPRLADTLALLLAGLAAGNPDPAGSLMAGVEK